MVDEQEILQCQNSWLIGKVFLLMYLNTMGLKGLFLNHAFLDRICPIFSFEYIQNLWQNYVSKSLEGFLKLDYNYVKNTYAHGRTGRQLSAQNCIRKVELQEPFSFYKIVLLLIQCKFDENYLKLRYLPWLGNND